MEKQWFPQEMKGHFNLRCPKGDKPTQVYFVVCIDNKQYKLSTGVKIYPSMWNQNTQTAIVSNQQTRQDNRNNRIVNEKINEINGLFSKFKSYLCSTEEEITNIPYILQTYIYKDMKKKEINTVNIIQSAFDAYNNERAQKKESSKKQDQRTLNKFIKYLEEKKLEHDIKVFSQSGLNKYKQYLIELNDTMPQTINRACGLIESLINKVLCVNDDFLIHNLSQVKFVKLKDNRQKDELGAQPLKTEELEKMDNCKDLTEIERQYKDLFLFQCVCGWRIGDIYDLLNGGKNIVKEDKEILRIETEKKGTFATLYLNEKLPFREEGTALTLLQQVRGYEYKFCDKRSWGSSIVNRKLKAIAKKANLDRGIQRKDTDGKISTDKVFNLISSHWGRSTMIKREVLNGTPKNIIMMRSGHTDDAMIDRYAKFTQEEKEDFFKSYYSNPKEETKVKNEERNAIKDLFAYNELKAVEELLNSGNDGFHSKAADKAVSTIKNLSTYKDYKTVETEKVKELENTVFLLTWHSGDTEILTAFQMKEKHFGIIDHIDNYDEITLKLHNYQLEYNKGIEDFQLKEWEERNN